MAFPTVLVFLLITIVVIQIRLQKSTRLDQASKEEFWEKEQQSLVVRKKAFHAEDFIQVPEDGLELRKPSKLDQGDQLYYSQLIQTNRQLEQEDMMNFSHLSNTDLRIRYGTANQTIVAENEANYNNYLNNLAKLADIYKKYDDDSQAIAILERCIAMNSDTSKHYLALGELYHGNHMNHKLLPLIDLVEKSDLRLKKGLLESLRSFSE